METRKTEKCFRDVSDNGTQMNIYCLIFLYQNSGSIFCVDDGMLGCEA